MRIAEPIDILKPYIKYYWGIENNNYSNDYHIRIVPTGLIEVDFYLGEKPDILQSDREIGENTVINGQQRQFFDLHITDKLLLFSVVFQPAGAMMFFDVPIKELYNRNVPLRYFLKAPIHKLEEMLYEANSFEERVGLMDGFLFELLARNNKDFEHSRIESTINKINLNNGNVSIESLASTICLSRKQFERTFTEHVGSTPKQFLRTVRFQYVIHTKINFPKLTLTELAYKCGYYDQSHMITDFKVLTGMTPKQYFYNCDLVSDYFT